MPKTINIDEIIEGMESYSEINNKFGQTLVGAKVILNDKHKKILKTWNISSIEIASEDKSGNDESEGVSQEAAINLVAEKISWEPRNKYEEEIINMAINSAMILLKNGGANAAN